MELEFFMAMQPPTVTNQMHRAIARPGKKTLFVDSPELKDARQKLTAYLGAYVPDRPLSGPVRLTTKWCFPTGDGRHQNGDYKITRPDTDNLIKLFKDVMSKLGYWQDDAQVASEITEKFWADTPGIYVKVTELPL